MSIEAAREAAHEIISDLLSMCDVSNWDAEGYRDLEYSIRHEVYERLHDFAADWQQRIGALRAVEQPQDIVKLRAVLDAIENEGDLYTAAGDIVVWDDCMPEIRAAIDELERLRAVERPADPRGWREAMQAVVDHTGMRHTRRVDVLRLALTEINIVARAAIRALSPAPKDREQE